MWLIISGTTEELFEISVQPDQVLVKFGQSLLVNCSTTSRPRTQWPSDLPKENPGGQGTSVEGVSPGGCHRELHSAVLLLLCRDAEGHKPQHHSVP